MAIGDNPIAFATPQSWATVGEILNPPERISITLSQAQMDADDARIEQLADEYFYQRGIES